MSGPADIEACHERLYRSGWSMGEVGTSLGWLVTGTNGENAIRATGFTSSRRSPNRRHRRSRRRVRGAAEEEAEERIGRMVEETVVAAPVWAVWAVAVGVGVAAIAVVAVALFLFSRKAE
jgi:hypothetical protein